MWQCRPESQGSRLGCLSLAVVAAGITLPRAARCRSSAIWRSWGVRRHLDELHLAVGRVDDAFSVLADFYYPNAVMNRHETRAPASVDARLLTPDVHPNKARRVRPTTGLSSGRRGSRCSRTAHR